MSKRLFIRFDRRFLTWLPLAFFGALLLARAPVPQALVFDEVHYVPASKALLSFSGNLNWVHPPLAKLIMGLGWLVFAKLLHLVGEPTVFRCVSIGFGLWGLWGVRAWMKHLGFTEGAAQAALWLTGFNFLWFVQSKTAMLDAFYVAFGIWGLLDLRAGKPWRGWVLLGCAAACKWAAAPFFVLALMLARQSWRGRVAGIALALACYLLTFVPLAFLEDGAVAPSGWIAYHARMLRGFESIAAAPHSYASAWWEWPTLIRPMWFTYETTPTTERSVWAGGNPALYWVALPALLAVLVAAIRSLRRKTGSATDRAARVLAAFYWIPLLFWVVAPRKLQLYYYYLPSSLWVGPIIAWAHERLRAQTASEVRRARGWLLIGFVLLCALAFFYFLPIMDGRILPLGRFRRYMWLESWI